MHDEQKKYSYDDETANNARCYERKSMGSVSLSAGGELGGLALMRLSTSCGGPLQAMTRDGYWRNEGRDLRPEVSHHVPSAGFVSSAEMRTCL